MTKVLVKALRKAMLCLMVATMVVGFMPAVSLADEDETQSVGTAQEEQAAQEAEAAEAGAELDTASEDEGVELTDPEANDSPGDGAISESLENAADDEETASQGVVSETAESEEDGSLFTQEQSLELMANNFSPRTSRPDKSNAWFYSSKNPYYSNNLAPTGNKNSSGVYVTGNCTWYAWGRAGEILGSAPKIGTGSPDKMWSYVRNNGTYKTGSTPKVGALCIGKSYGSWHVSVVEKIENGVTYVSESGYKTSSSKPSASTIYFHYGSVSSWMSSVTGYIYLIDDHTCSFSVSSYSYYNDINHTVNYNKCSCGATKSSERKAHSFAWSGLTYKCSLCGTEYAPHGANSEYVTRVEVDIHSGDNAGTSVLASVPGSTVVKVGETKQGSWGRWMGYVTYGGVSGWIHMSDVRYNGTAGIHSFKKGTCTVCGINQTGTKPGVYKTKHDSTLYYQNVWGSPRKTVAAGEEVAIVRIGITTEGYYWGYTSDGYCMSMTDLGYTRTGTVTGTPVTVPNGNYYIKLAKDTSFQMDIYNGSKDSGAKLTIYQVNNSGAQQFRLTKNSNGSYSIMNINSGMYLDAYSNGKTNGTAVWQYKGNGSEAQQWYIERNDDGTYSFRGVGSNLYMHIYDGKVTNSNAVHLWENRTSDNSHWYLAPMSASKKLTRLAGTDRYKTMAQIVKTEVAKTSTWAIVANGDKFPDALGSAALAGAYGAPIVTTKKGKLDASAKAQLKRLKAKYVLVLGDSKSISTKTLKQIKSLPSVKSVKRVSGKDRYATSLAVYKQFKSKTKSYSTLLIVDGATYVDALMSGAYAYAKKVPILLAKGGKLTSAAVKAVKADKKIKKIVVVSTGSKVNAKKIKSQLGSKYTYKTISGKSAYSTNASFINWSIRQGMTASKPVIATAKKYADAITGSVLAGKNNSVLVLADKATDASVKELAKYKLEMKNAYMLGDKNSVSVKNAKAIAKKLGLTYVTHSTDSAKKS